MNIQEIVAGIGSNSALQAAAGKAGISPDQAQAALQGVLEHVSAGQPADGVVESVAARAGIDPAQVQQVLPSILGALQQHAANAPEGAGGGLSGLLGSLQSSPLGGLLAGLDANKDGSVVDDALGMVKGLFGGKHA